MWHVISNLPTVQPMVITDKCQGPVSPVGVLVLLRLPVGVELAVLGHHAVPLAVGVDHAEYPRPPGERVPSATLSLELETQRRLTKNLRRFHNHVS